MRLHLCAATLAAAALLLPARADGPLTLTNEDVVILAQAGLPEDFVIRRIDGSLPKFDLSAGAIADLAKRGLSTRVLEAMIARGIKPVSSVPQGFDGAAAIPGATFSITHYASDVEISWAGGEHESARLGVRLLAQDKGAGRLTRVLTVGLKPAKTTAYLIGPHAQARSRTGMPEFRIHPPEGVAIEEFVLVKMAQKHDRREVEIGSLKQVVPTDIRPESDGTFRVVPQQRLEMGEYFLYIHGSAEFERGVAGKGYEFAVD